MPNELETIISLARDLPAEERAAYLDEAAGGDAARRAELDDLLAQWQEADAFFDEPATVLRPRAVRSESEGTMIGSYKLLQQIGEGGFGTVWMAEQQQPVRRRVALKIIKAGMDTKEVVARFEQERQALAMMDHPNIARVFDAGATESGRLYFVMELVKGIPITQYCDEERLPVKGRLELFTEVCRAIHHAHQKGIIHRDIKPSNILVARLADAPMLKIIDFGIAKATQQSLTDKTLFTRFEQFIGTPAYMSPEQASAGVVDIDIRSDIYSLGVLLYELLTGKPPFDPASLLSAGYDEMRRVICEDEPPKPSARLSTVAGVERTELAKSHQVEPARLGHLVKGDLDWIVMRAIEKDRTRRYESANALVADIRHYLADEPVSATPPGAGYLLRKYARRHRAALSVAAVVALLLLAGTVTSTLLMIRALEAERKSRQLAVRAQAAEQEAKRQLAAAVEERGRREAFVRSFTDVLQSSDRARGDRDITAYRLDRAAESIALTDSPARQARVRSLLGGSYAALGNPAQAIPLQQAARDFYLHDAEFGPEAEVTILATAALAWSCESGEAIPLQRRVLAWQQAQRPAGHPDISQAMGALGRTLHRAGETKEGLALLEEALRLSRANPGSADRRTLPLLHWLATACEASADKTRRALARALDAEILQLSRQPQSPQHGETIAAIQTLAGQIEHPDLRRAWQEELGKVAAQSSGMDDPYTLAMLACQVATPLKGAPHSPVLEALENQLRHRLAACTERPPDTRTVLDHAAAAARAGEKDRALELLEKAAWISAEFRGPGHPDTLAARAALAEASDVPGTPGRALTIREELLPLCMSHPALGPWHPQTVAVREALVSDYLDAQRRVEAVRLSERALDLALNLPESDPRKFALKAHLAATLHAVGRSAEAFTTQRSLHRDSIRLTPPDEAAVRTARAVLETYRLAAGIPENYEGAGDGHIMTKLPALRPVRTPIISQDQPWKWLHPMDGTDPAVKVPGFHTSFYRRDFDDQEWRSSVQIPGPGRGFGYAKESSHVIGAPPPGQRYSAYFRHSFTVQRPHAGVELRCRHDDGIIVYLDDHEVARSNVAPGVPESYRLEAQSAYNDPEIAVLRVIPLPALPPGPHTLAISLHNSKPDSSDLHLTSMEVVEVEGP